MDWLDIPMRRALASPPPTWSAVAERYDRCRRRVGFYVRRQGHPTEVTERIVASVVRANLDLLIAADDELSELRRLMAAADILMLRLRPAVISI
jgi:hypothetical protein